MKFKSVPVPKKEKGGENMIKAISLKKILIFGMIFLIFFGVLYYKIFLFGNNISKNRSASQTEDMLNAMKNYCAEMEVTVNSNKTQNSYAMKQEVEGDWSMQEVTKGENIEGVKIELNGSNLKVSNSRLNLEKVYENYQNLLNNAMFLNSFVADYENEKNTSNCYEENGELILEVNLNNHSNTYINHKKLYVDVKTGKPTKLEIKDNTQKETICILYNNVEFK